MDKIVKRPNVRREKRCRGGCLQPQSKMGAASSAGEGTRRYSAYLRLRLLDALLLLPFFVPPPRCEPPLAFCRLVPPPFPPPPPEGERRPLPLRVDVSPLLDDDFFGILSFSAKESLRRPNAGCMADERAEAFDPFILGQGSDQLRAKDLRTCPVVDVKHDRGGAARLRGPRYRPFGHTRGSDRF
jgi:hypothetical protein